MAIKMLQFPGTMNSLDTSLTEVSECLYQTMKAGSAVQGIVLSRRERNQEAGRKGDTARGSCYGRSNSGFGTLRVGLGRERPSCEMFGLLEIIGLLGIDIKERGAVIEERIMVDRAPPGSMLSIAPHQSGPLSGGAGLPGSHGQQCFITPSQIVSSMRELQSRITGTWDAPLRQEGVLHKIRPHEKHLPPVACVVTSRGHSICLGLSSTGRLSYFDPSPSVLVVDFNEDQVGLKVKSLIGPYQPLYCNGGLTHLADATLFSMPVI